MSPVVFTEGKHDLNFLSSLHREFGYGNFDQFNNQDAETRQETRVRQHRFDTSMEFLYKAEGGRSEIYKKFRSHIDRIRNLDLIILVDFDGDSTTQFFSEFNNVLDDQFKGIVSIDYKLVNENAHMNFFECEVVSQSMPSATFKLISFKQCLEDVSNIKDCEDRTEWIRKSKLYIDHCPNIMDDISEFLY